ncbi:MAG: hypothetical protein DRO67_10420, partial [Candidatus Asgardarchaeum californiense]
MYTDKRCSYKNCNRLFTPSTGNQKYCSSCSKKAKQVKDRIRWRKYNRRLKGYIEYNKECRLCGKKFTTHYKKKIYCGQNECEIKRVKINSRKAELKRNKKRRKQTQIRREERRKDDLLKIKDYFSSFNYKIIDDSGYVNS